jgi:hypothetical protein
MTHDETQTGKSDGTRVDPSDRTAPTYSGERARQGRIVLNTPRRRAIFIAGLVGFVLLALISATVW